MKLRAGTTAALVGMGIGVGLSVAAFVIDSILRRLGAGVP